YRADGSQQPGWPVDVHHPLAKKKNRVMTTPLVADLNQDGVPEVTTGSNETVGGGDGAGSIFVIDGRGNKAPGGPYLPNWPVVVGSLHLFPTVAEGIGASPVGGDFDGDGVIDVVAQGNGSPPLIVKSDPGKQSGFANPPNNLPVKSDGTRGVEPT